MDSTILKGKIFFFFFFFVLAMQTVRISSRSYIYFFLRVYHIYLPKRYDFAIANQYRLG